MDGFKWFLLNENRAYFGHRISDVRTAVQDLQQDMDGMGSRQIARVAESLVGQIRKILHSQWPPQYTPKLKELQRIGVALMKAIDEKDDLKELIPTVAQQLAELSGKLGTKTNNLQAPEVPGGEGPNGQQMDMQLTGNGQPPQQQPQGMPQDPSMQQPMGLPPQLNGPMMPPQ
jgi:hypothetical protein